MTSWVARDKAIGCTTVAMNFSYFHMEMFKGLAQTVENMGKWIRHRGVKTEQIVL